MRLLLGGVTDFSGGCRFNKHVSSPKAAVAGAQETDFKILLAHQPKNIFEAAESGFDLQLSGHPHGGQFLPWKYAVGLNQPFLSGRINLRRLKFMSVGVQDTGDRHFDWARRLKYH